MGDSTQRGAVLAGLGTYLPSYVLTNDMLAHVVDTSDEWIRTRTGIRQRHIAGDGERTGDLAVEAGGRALASAGVDTVQALVVATTTPDQTCPATAPQVAQRLGLGTIAAFDVSAACSGFLYALATTTSLIRSGLFDSVLLIGSDTFSTTLDPTDRSTRALIGDGAGAVVVRRGAPDEPGALLDFDLGSDGSKVDLLLVPAVTPTQRAEGRADNYFQMRGKPVFSNAVLRMTESVTRLLAEVGWEAGKVDHLVPHQANARILTEVANRLGIEPERTVVNIDQVGNTVAASIPLAMAHGVQQRRIRPGDRVVLTGFGAGLTWGTAALEWPNLTDVSI
ncbi:beta-ketoacyl-ACP synthase III [Salinactinospora qingdaonensis]|uniref:Beta-ketoacyl-[acyl-carrier-protein] synthase III n=1 Tax=Salinactinospora qingdaonensis TaxID=702744 RepID=A0ABP7FE36_9ACTN